MTVEDSLFAEYLAGDSVRDIAKRHQIPKSTVGRIVIEDGKRRIEDLEADLLAAELARDSGREPLWPAIVIPAQVQSDRMIAIDLFSWVIRRLRKRGWAIEVVTRHAGGGVVFQLTTVPRRGS